MSGRNASGEPPGRELLLLQPAHEHGVEPTRPHLQRRCHLHPVGLGLLPHPHSQLGQRVVHVAGVQRHVGIGRAPPRASRSAPRGRHGRRADRPARPRASRAAARRYGALNSRSSRWAQSLQAARAAPGASRSSSIASSGQRCSSHMRARLVGGALAAAADVGLQLVGQPRLAQQARACAGRPAGRRRCRPAARSAAAPAARAPPRCGRKAPSDPWSTGCRRRRTPAPPARRSAAGRGTPRPRRRAACRAQERHHLGPAQLQLGALAAGGVQRHGRARHRRSRRRARTACAPARAALRARPCRSGR